jgi:hypothetical protein
MKAAIETMTNKVMGIYKVSRFFNVPQTTLEYYIKDQEKSSNYTIKTKLGRKQVLPCEAENDLAEHCLWMDRKFFGLTISDVMRLSYQLAVRNGIKNQFCKRNEKAGRKWLKNFLRHHQETSVITPEGLSLSRARGFSPESIAQFFKSMNLQWTPFNIILQDLRQIQLHYCTAQTHQNIRIERQASDIFSSIRRIGISCDSHYLYESNWTLYIMCTSKEKYEIRTDEWHTAWINPC